MEVDKADLREVGEVSAEAEKVEEREGREDAVLVVNKEMSEGKVDAAVSDKGEEREGYPCARAGNAEESEGARDADDLSGTAIGIDCVAEPSVLLSGDNVPEIFHVSPRSTEQPQGPQGSFADWLLLADTSTDVLVETSKAAAETVLIDSEEEQPSSVQNTSIQLSLDDDNTGLQKLTPSEDVSAEVQVVESETEGK